MLTAACYIRVSTDEQTEYSPDSQLKLIRDYAAKNDICLLEDYIFAEDGGKSGKNMTKRTEFMKLIALTKKKPKPFDIILVWKFSRFARNQEESIVMKSMLKKNDIDVISISESIPDGPFGSLIERIIEWSDEYYLINLSQEVKRGMKERASRGEPVCPPPVGYDMKDGKYVPNCNAEAVRGMYEDYLNGVGCRAIALKYSAMGVRTKRGNELDNRCVEYILRNPVYIGKIRWSVSGRAASTRHYDDPNIMVIDGTHEPIIDSQTFGKVQDKLNEQKRRYAKYQRPEQEVCYMLKGLVRCSNCGATLVASNSKTPYLQCHNYGRGVCKVSHSILIKKLDQEVINYLTDVSLSGDFTVEPLNKSKSKTKTVDYNKILENENAKLERIRQAYQSGIDTLEEYKANKTRILDFIKKVKAEMKDAEPKHPDVDIEQYRQKIIDVLKVITNENESVTIKNQALRSIISKIVFNRPKNQLNFYFYE